jgi:hypothetical protein
MISYLVRSRLAFRRGADALINTFLRTSGSDKIVCSGLTFSCAEVLDKLSLWPDDFLSVAGDKAATYRAAYIARLLRDGANVDLSCEPDMAPALLPLLFSLATRRAHIALQANDDDLISRWVQTAALSDKLAVETQAPDDARESHAEALIRFSNAPAPSSTEICRPELRIVFIQRTEPWSPPDARAMMRAASMHGFFIDSRMSDATRILMRRRDRWGYY